MRFRAQARRDDRVGVGTGEGALVGNGVAPGVGAGVTCAQRGGTHRCVRTRAAGHALPPSQRTGSCVTERELCCAPTDERLEDRRHAGWQALHALQADTAQSSDLDGTSCAYACQTVMRAHLLPIPIQHQYRTDDAGLRTHARDPLSIVCCLISTRPRGLRCRSSDEQGSYRWDLHGCTRPGRRLPFVHTAVPNTSKT